MDSVCALDTNAPSSCFILVLAPSVHPYSVYFSHFIMAYQSSAYGGDHGLRIMRTRDHRVVVNIKDDVTAYNQHLTHLKVITFFFFPNGHVSRKRIVTGH